MSAIAANISGICAKDLISSEGKYHSSCYKAFVHIIYETDEAVNNPTEAMGNNNGEVYEAVYSFCEALISNPRVVEFKEVRNVLSDEADKLGVVVTQSQYKNLLRLISNKLEQLVFLNYQQNKVLMYPSTLKLETVVVENFELKSEVANQTSLDENSKTVINAAKILNEKIKYHPRAMAWPPEETDLGIDKVADCVPELLDTFCTILLSGQLLDRDKSRSDRIVRLKNSLAQDIVYTVSNGAIKTPKSVLFPSVVKALCNNTEVVKLINKCGHGIGYNLVEEIETEFALKVINEQTLNLVLISDECKQFNNLPVALMVADNIDNLEYLDTLDSPATDLKTAYEVLCRGREIKNKLQLNAVACVFDQAFYAKAMEVLWKQKEQFEGLFLMMGGFHLLMTLLAIIGDRFGDAGLRNVAVHSEVIAEGSIDSVLNGKHYNRGVRLHKIMYEAMTKLLLDDFENCLHEDSLELLSDHKTQLDQLKLNLC
ncbi:Hypothetical predicted protein [Paramuricea clavata]|uniref:Uncharacterized protein n=1 Tax=Paramuricea clavata TaxID=317549 RepID=A0A7D9I0Z6_PARCT|nr:Hypothetical predicted protein [Paramuricea clavata]